MAHPDGALRTKGFDRVHYPDGSSIDLKSGSARQVAAALEDLVVRGIWLEGVYGEAEFVVLARVEALTEWTPHALATADVDGALYKEQERSQELTGEED